MATSVWKVYAILTISLFQAALSTLGVRPVQLQLVHDLLEFYDKKSKPTWDNARAVNVTFSMDLYQILELNEPQQYILLNAWIIERWNDEFLYWNPADYDNITEIRLPYDQLWMPDTTLYNSLVMKDDETRRLFNAKLTANTTRRAAFIELLYPTIYKFSCLLNLRFFPFDVQICTMTFSSWTYDQKGIDYFSFSDRIGTSSYLENEGWYVLTTKAERKEVKYSCCPNKYTLLQLTLYLRRKPLFYMVNLIIPTSIITLIAIVGFFTTSSASGAREEKVSLGITTLLSMSILMLMVSDQMPTTSTFIPLIGWFILGMIVVISIGTLCSSIIIATQKRGSLGERLRPHTARLFKFFAYLSYTEIPAHLLAGTRENEEAPSATLYRASRKNANAAKRRKRPENNGIPRDKSTDMIFSPSVETTLTTVQSPQGQLQLDLVCPYPGGPQSPPPLTLPLPSPTPHDVPDGTSGAESDAESLRLSRQPSTLKSRRYSKTDVLRQITCFAGNLKENRRLAQVEFEWAATVMERCCFIIFVSSFMAITIGINVYGYMHWKAAESQYV